MLPSPDTWSFLVGRVDAENIFPVIQLHWSHNIRIYPLNSNNKKKMPVLLQSKAAPKKFMPIIWRIIDVYSKVRYGYSFSKISNSSLNSEIESELKISLVFEIMLGWWLSLWLVGEKFFHRSVEKALLQSHLFGMFAKFDVIFDFRRQPILGYLFGNLNQRASPKSRWMISAALNSRAFRI